MFEFVAEKLEKINYSSGSTPLLNVLKSDKTPYNNPLDFISIFTDMSSCRTAVADGKNQTRDDIKDGEIESFVCLKRINDFDHLNKFFKAVNKKLPAKGLFICFAETKEQRFARIIRKYPKYFAYPYYLLDFIVKRLFPKWGPTKKLYYLLTKGNNRVLSMPEMLGRLVFNGFKINYLKDINNLTYFVAEKLNDTSDRNKPSYGALFKMERIGMNGKKMNVYKLRTMHPYAEFLQSFMYSTFDLKQGGKFNRDFRIANWGRVLRRFWIDELPMICNWLKGDLKLVGLRPLSEQYLSLYNDNYKERRLKYRPGLIPPFYSDLPRTLDEIMESEIRYLDAYDENPLLTDIKYFFICLSNILFKGARSS